MGAKLALISLVVCLSLAQGWRADVVKLSNGGELKGSLEELAFLADGKQTQHLRNSISAIWLSQATSDHLTLNDGTKLEGQIVSAKVRTAGGVMSLARHEFTGLQLVEPEPAPAVDANHKRLAEKRARVAPDDPKGLIELACWCRENGLKPESEELAKACLEANPDYDSAEKAHEILGHVLYQDEWMTPAEMARRKTATEGTIEPGPLANEEMTEAELAGLTPALKQALARNEELYKTYCAKATEAANNKLNAARQKYSAQNDKLAAEIKQLTAAIRAKEEQLAKSAGTSPGGSSSSTETWSYVHTRGQPGGGGQKVKDGLAADREALKSANDQRSKIAGLVEASHAAISDACKKNKELLRAVYLRFKQALLAGKNISPKEMAAAYEAVLRAK